MGLLLLVGNFGLRLRIEKEWYRNVPVCCLTIGRQSCERSDVNLRVEKENAGAQQFYKRIGFAEDPSHIVMSQGRKPDGKEVGGAAEDKESGLSQCGSAGRTLPKGSFKNHFAEIIGNAAVLALAASALAFAFESCSAVVDVGTVGSCVVAFTLGQAIACGAGAVLVLGWIFVTLKSPVIEEGHNDPTISDVDDTTDVFGAVLASLPSLSGKTVAVTGCTSGIGLQVAIAAVRLGCAEVILLNRTSARARDAEKGLRSLAEKVWATNAADPRAKKPNHGKKTAVRTVPCNLLSFESVKQAAGAVAAAVGPLGGLDVLCCNAGIYCGEDLRTPDGFDITAAVSHLSHFLLTRKLLPSLNLAAKMRGQSRVVQHHSGARNGVRLDEDSNPARAFSGHYEPERYLAASQPGTLGGDGPNARFPRYRQAKLSQALFAMELDRRLRARASRASPHQKPVGGARTRENEPGGEFPLDLSGLESLSRPDPAPVSPARGATRVPRRGAPRSRVLRPRGPERGPLDAPVLGAWQDSGGPGVQGAPCEGRRGRLAK